MSTEGVHFGLKPASPTGLTFRVRGIPVPQGTARAFMAGGRPRLATDANRLNSPIGAWRAAIQAVAQSAMEGRALLTGAIEVQARFTFPRPESLPRRVNQPDVKPDLDKLARALLDGLTGVVFRDDGQVVRLDVVKAYDSDQPGVLVSVLETAGGRR